MREFFKDKKGAVTVFVTLLLVPAILISGTAVDLARMYTARNTLQNANLLAANAVLSQYDTLLNDVYGLFGIMQEDPILGGMLFDFINVSVFGGEGQDVGMGTLQPFHGTILQDPDVDFESGKNLGNPDVLLHQIREYMRLRAPILLIDEIELFAIVETFTNLFADARVIHQTQVVDGLIEDLSEEYEKIYDLINEITELIEQIQTRSHETNINQILNTISGQFDELVDLRDSYDNAEVEINPIDGTVIFDWPAHYAGLYDDAAGRLASSARDLRDQVTAMRQLIDDLAEKLDELVTTSRGADVIREDVLREVNKLDDLLESASRTLQLGYHSPIGDKTAMERYLDKVDLDGASLESLAVDFRNFNYTRITILRTQLDNMGFGSVSGANIDPNNSTSLDNLSNARNYFSLGSDGIFDMAAITNFTYTFDLSFRTYQQSSPAHIQIYNILDEWFAEEDDLIEQIETSLLDMFGVFFSIFTDIVTDTALIPEGRIFYGGEEIRGTDEDTLGDDWGGNPRGGILRWLNPFDGIIQTFQNIADFDLDRLILVTYGTRMFSNFTSAGKPYYGDETMSGVSLNSEINFFFQSEQEYLFHGNLRFAIGNLIVVSNWIFLIRFVMNFISTFIVPFVKVPLAKMKVAGIKGFLAAVVARAKWALSETITDKLVLRSGESVPLVKIKDTEWHLSPAGKPGFIRKLIGAYYDHFAHVNTFVEVFEGNMSLVDGPGFSIEFEDGKLQHGVDLGLDYGDYVALLLLFLDNETLTQRIGHLISLNATHHRDDEANVNFLNTVHTDFTITTVADVRMLFFGMPMFQRAAGESGRDLFSSLIITSTDRRGY